MPAPFDAQEFVGLSFDEASSAAEQAGWTVRRIDPGAAYTMEFRADRLNLQVEDERVVGATVG